MAVGESKSTGNSGRRWLVGTNVVVATALVVALVVIAQALAYSAPRRWDFTSSGVNSLSDASENLVRDLDQKIRITSLYFETDREEEDQPRYRRAMEDLVGLYEATNRSRISAEWINPLKDHEKFGKMMNRLREKPAFKKEIESYQAAISRFTGQLDARIRELIQSELGQIESVSSSMGGGQSAVAPIENLLMRMSSRMVATRDRIDGITIGDAPQYSAAINEIKAVYSEFTKAITDIGNYGGEQALRNPTLPPEQLAFLQGSRGRYAEIATAIEAETTSLQALEPLTFDDLTRELAPTANALLVETDDDARVVDFGSIWAPMQQGAAARAGFKNRAFKGEEKLTSAILRITHKEQTAVVFVRYGGQPLFMGGFMPGQPPALYANMKLQLEDANFVVEEWDVKTTQTPPVIDPQPTRTIYVVLKPTPPQHGPMGQPSQEPPFAENHRRAVLDAIGDNGRALFIGGWYPGPFGPVPSTYEFEEYLSDNWGVKLDTSFLLIETMSTDPGKYVVGRRDFYNMNQFEVSDHDIVKGASASILTLPWCAPLELSKTPPTGVTLHRLVTQPARDGLWGVKNIQEYQKQLEQREYLTRVEGDVEQSFDLAVAATQGDAKIVVVSGRDFATDAVAFAREMAFSSQGLTLRHRNPGNSALLINSLHWLNDNSKFMDLGKPIDAAVLEVGSTSTLKAVQALTIFVWPMLAVVLGGVTWWVRRR